MQIIRNNCPILLHPDFCISAALLILLLPIRWLIAWVFAAAFHELCHYVALRFFRMQVYSIHVGLGGAVMQTGQLTMHSQLVCAAAGPLGGICLLLIRKQFPELALCGLIQSLYNLLPVLPLDGGRILQSVVCMIFSRKTCNIILRFVNVTVMISLFWIAVLCAAYFGWGIMPVLWAVLFAVKHSGLKIPCKRKKQIVQ